MEVGVNRFCAIASLQEGVALVTPDPGGLASMRPYQGVAGALEVGCVVRGVGFATAHVTASETDPQILGPPARLTRVLRRWSFSSQS